MSDKKAIGYNELSDIKNGIDVNFDEAWDKLPPAMDCEECLHGDRGAPRGNLQELSNLCSHLTERLYDRDQREVQRKLENFVAIMEKKFKEPDDARDKENAAKDARIKEMERLLNYALYEKKKDVCPDCWRLRGQKHLCGSCHAPEFVRNAKQILIEGNALDSINQDPSLAMRSSHEQH